MRLERLVGRRLDLAKLEAHRFTLLRKRSTWSGCASRPTPLRRGSPAVARSTDEKRFDSRPTIVRTATACCKSSPTCSSNAFRWTRTAAGCSSSSPRTDGPSRSPRRHGSGVPGKSGAYLSSVLVTRRLRHRTGLTIAHELAVALGGRIELGFRARQRSRSSSFCRPSTIGSAANGAPGGRPVIDLPRPCSRLRAALVSLRPRQWTKNLLLFARDHLRGASSTTARAGSRRSPRSRRTARLRARAT